MAKLSGEMYRYSPKEHGGNTHSHVLHRAWSLEVFQDDDGLEVVHHEDGLGRLQGVRTVRQFLHDCQKVWHGLLQDSQAFNRCYLFGLHQPVIPLRKQKSTALTNHITAGREDYQFCSVIY